jgi:hypothetical protein
MSSNFTRQQLAKFIDDNRTIKAFEGLQTNTSDLIIQVTDLDVRVADLANPGSVTVSANYQMTDTGKAVYIDTSGVIVTLPQATAERVGVIWTITMGVAGTATLVCTVGDSFPTPDVLAETTVLFDARGTTLDFRCVSTNKWAIV